MIKRIRTTEPALVTIRDTGVSLPRLEPSDIQEMLGAEEAVGRLEEALAPITLFAVREELVKRVQRSGVICSSARDAA